jgi:quercetin dioxygenase-like cupin family protein
MVEQRPVEPVDLAALARQAPVAGVAWSHAGADLNANVVLFDAGQGVAEHVNDEVEVLVVALVGAGFAEVDGRRHDLAPGMAIAIPAGARRAIGSAGERFGYLTCHRRRAGLWPRGLPRPGGGA